MKGNLARNRAAEDALLHAILAAHDVRRTDMIVSQREVEFICRYFNSRHKLVKGTSASTWTEKRKKLFRALVVLAQGRNAYKSFYA